MDGRSADSLMSPTTKISGILGAAAAILCFSADFATAEDVLNLRSIQDMCGPRWGHRDFVDQTECMLRVLPQSNNPDLIPANPYIGWYTQMALKMIDDVRNKRVSEAEARENMQQAYHEVYVRQIQAARDQDDQETLERKQASIGQERVRADADARQSVIDDRNASIEQARLDRFCASAARSVEDTCSMETKNPRVAVALCATARILYAKQGCI
jgi:hypothetical protein